MKKSFPASFVEKMDSLLTEEASLFWKALLDQPAHAGLRLNPLKTTFSELKSLLDITLSPVSWAPYGYFIDPQADLGKHPLHAAGLFYLQEPSAMAPVAALDPQPGERILDIAAAPGGKTTQIASLMKDQGLLIANDPHPQRVYGLAQNLERWGAKNAIITQEKPRKLAEHFGAYFDKVLVDAPCSGEGMFRLHPSERKQWTENFVQRCARRQDEILWYAAKLVRPGGILVYSTCTFSPQENEGRIAQFLTAREDFQITEIKPLSDLSSGRPAWINGPENLIQTRRIWPHLSKGEGHYIARLKRNPGDKVEKQASSYKKQVLTPEVSALYQGLYQQLIKPQAELPSLDPDNSNISLFNDKLFAVPPGSPNILGLRGIYWGWHLATFKGTRLIPSHALALGLNPENVQSVLKLALDDPELIRYFRGLTIHKPGDSSWVLVCVEDYPVGWGKRTDGKIKSHSPRWLRQF